MTSKTIILMDKPVTLKISTCVDEKDRMARAKNVAHFLNDNWDILSAVGKSISSKRLRDLMIECLGDLVKNVKGEVISTLPSRASLDASDKDIRAGDDRAHGDTIGEHCLRLECQTVILSGKRARILLLNGNNKEKIRIFLVRVSTEVVDVIP